MVASLHFPQRAWQHPRKTTFDHAHLEAAGLRFINADVLAADLGLEAYATAKLAEALRLELVRRKESFVFETVFSPKTSPPLSQMACRVVDPDQVPGKGVR